MKNKKALLGMSFLFIILLALGFAVGYLFIFKEDAKEEKTKETQTKESSNLSDYQFAEYELINANYTSSVAKQEIQSDLSNVYYTKKNDPKLADYAIFDNNLATAQKQALASEEFIITPGKSKEFFSVYEENRYNYAPSFITTDSVLHTYHLIFNSTLEQLEMNYLNEETDALVKEMVTKSQEQYDQSSLEEVKDAAKRNIAYFAVAAKLIDPDYDVPQLVKNEVEKELDLIEAHSEIQTVSPVLSIGFDNPNDIDNVKEDYTQYIPRGHYTKNDQLKNYFKSVMWMGRMTFLVKDETTSTSGFLASDILRQNNDLYIKWDDLSSTITFFVGRSDDLGVYEYKKILDQILPGANITAATADQLETLWSEAKKLEPPKLNSIPIYDESTQENKDEATKGFRFFGQRYTLDANIFQNLIYRSVKETTNSKKKMLPSFIEIPAAMGDESALEIIDTDTDYADYPNYQEQMTNLQSEISNMNEDEWTWNLYSSWLYTLESQVGEVDDNFPQFMQSPKWEKKELNTFAGSWTELKHDTILYSKQVYAELGSMGPEDEPDDRGYIEPNVVLWDRLQALVGMTKDGLLSRNIISPTDSSSGCAVIEDYKQKIYCNLTHMEDTVLDLHDISIKELEGKELSDDEYDFIRYFGGDLESMYMATLDPGADVFAALDDNPAMLVADVATDPNGYALEEATGYINYIYVIVQIDGELRIARGGVYSQYEFVNDSKNRLTDEAWRQMLEKGDVPEMTKWQKSLITK